MDPSFFADLDPDFKNPDLDPSVFCFKKLMGSKLCSLRNMTKNDSVESAKYDICNNFL